MLLVFQVLPQRLLEILLTVKSPYHIFLKTAKERLRRFKVDPWRLKKRLLSQIQEILLYRAWPCDQVAVEFLYLVWLWLHLGISRTISHFWLVVSILCLSATFIHAFYYWILRAILELHSLPDTEATAHTFRIGPLLVLINCSSIMFLCFWPTRIWLKVCECRWGVCGCHADIGTWPSGYILVY